MKCLFISLVSCRSWVVIPLQFWKSHLVYILWVVGYPAACRESNIWYLQDLTQKHKSHWFLSYLDPFGKNKTKPPTTKSTMDRKQEKKKLKKTTTFKLLVWEGNWELRILCWHGESLSLKKTQGSISTHIISKLPNEMNTFSSSFQSTYKPLTVLICTYYLHSHMTGPFSSPPSLLFILIFFNVHHKSQTTISSEINLLSVKIFDKIQMIRRVLGTPCGVL